MNELTVTEQNTNSFIAPVVDIQSALARYNAFNEFVSKILKKDKDFGEIPGTNKPTLLKAGAEKLGAFFGLRPIFALQESVNDWTGKDHNNEPFFYRQYKSQLYRSGELVGEGIGSCNSWEKKYRYRWMNELEIPGNVDKSTLEHKDGAISEFEFAIDKAETSGKYGKPAEYWQQFKDAIDDGTAKLIQRPTKKGGRLDAWEIGGKLYAVPNKDVAEQVNTIDKMAQKRAFVAAILIATNASDYFTQDMEDFRDNEQSETRTTTPIEDLEIVDANFTEIERQKPTPEPKSAAQKPKAWPVATIKTLMEKYPEITVAAHAVNLLYLSKKLTPEMPVETILGWVHVYRDARDNGKMETGEAASTADKQVFGG